MFIIFTHWDFKERENGNNTCSLSKPSKTLLFLITSHRFCPSNAVLMIAMYHFEAKNKHWIILKASVRYVFCISAYKILFQRLVFTEFLLPGMEQIGFTKNLNVAPILDICCLLALSKFIGCSSFSHQQQSLHLKKIFLFVSHM